MSTTPVPSKSDKLAQIKSLLDKSLPSCRQAYSDRTAWLMACLSEISYIKFNPFFHKQSKDYFLAVMNELADESCNHPIKKLISMVDYDPEEEKEKLNNDLKALNFALVKTFDCDGTQAILVKNDEFIVLALRGTEEKSIKDIITDLDARLTDCESGGRIHSGFEAAYAKVAQDIQVAINADEIKQLPLFITGHSLGGALATIAAKKLQHAGGIAACYTYGSPRVGDDTWVAGMKTSVYRIVNAADCVTMLPPSNLVIMGLAWLFDNLELDGIAVWLRKRIQGYMHCGNMRYMTNCEQGDYEKVMLLYSVSFLYRIKGWWNKNFAANKFLRDHFIEIYKEKLFVIARRRNNL